MTTLNIRVRSGAGGERLSGGRAVRILVVVVVVAAAAVVVAGAVRPDPKLSHSYRLRRFAVELSMLE